VRRWLRLLILPIAFAWLHALATWPVFGGWSRFSQELLRIPADLVLLVALAVVGGAARWPRLVSWVCAALLVVGLLARAGEAMAQAGFGQALTFDHLTLLKPLARQWWDSVPPDDRWWTVALHAGRFALLLTATYFAFGAIARRANGRRTTALVLAALQVLAVVGFVSVSLSPGLDRRWRSSDLLAFADVFVDEAAKRIDPSAIEASIRRAQSRMAAAPQRLEGLGGVDVHFLVIESYGRSAWRDAKVTPRVRALWSELEPALRQRGFGVCTSAVAPTIRGGGSWLAHAELLTSVRVPDPSTCELVLASGITPLTKVFGNAGYHVVEVMPAMDVHWPEGEAYYGIDEHVTSLEFDYEGYDYSFAHVPDQFALHHVLKRCVEPAQQPVLVSFISATSHAPWAKLPPYVADWQIDAGTFADGPARDFGLTYEDAFAVDRLLPAYVESLDYALRCAVGYVQRLPRPSLVVLLGDHQPLFGPMLSVPDKSHDVPMHVFSNRPELLQPFVEMGFRSGIDLPETQRAMPLSEFAPAFLRAFGDAK